MIQNERQYKVTKAKLKDLEQELSKLLENRDLATNTHPRLIRIQSAALEDQIQVMYGEIAALVPKKMIDQISCLKCLKTKGLSSHPSLTVQCQLSGSIALNLPTVPFLSVF